MFRTSCNRNAAWRGDFATGRVEHRQANLCAAIQSQLAHFNNEMARAWENDELLHARQTGLGHSGGLGTDKQDWKTIESSITVGKY